MYIYIYIHKYIYIYIYIYIYNIYKMDLQRLFQWFSENQMNENKEKCHL